MSAARRVLSILTTAVVVASGATVLSASPASAVTVTTWDSLVNAFAAGGQVTLGASITVSGASLTVGAGRSVTLDLAGRSLSITDPGSGNPAVKVPGDSGTSLTIGSSVAGGSLTATGGFDGAGIGSERSSVGADSVTGSITITGGTVVATGGEFAAGIGGGLYNRGGAVSISGGTVTATGGAYGGAGVGSGYLSGDAPAAGRTLTVSGGSLTAKGGLGGAGIGGGRSGAAWVVVVSGGTVNATGGNDSAGIGPGYFAETFGQNRGGSLSVTGGTVTATAGSGQAAAVGGSRDSWGIPVEVAAGASLSLSGARAFGRGQPYNIGDVVDYPFGSLTNNGLVTITAGSTLTIPAGESVTNNQTITNNGSITGTGTIVNPGLIVGSGTVANNGQGGSGTTVTGHSYLLTFDPNGAPGQTSTTFPVFAGSVQQAGLDMPTPTVPAGWTFTGWRTAPTSGVVVGRNGTLAFAFGDGPTARTLYAQYTIEQAITFSSAPPSPARVGAPYTAVASGGGSGRPVVFSVGSGTTNNACTVSGSTVTLAHPGTCEIAADQAGSGFYTPAPTKTQSFTVGKATQTVVIASTAPTNARVGGPTYTVAASGGRSGNAVTYGIGAGTSPTGACTISGTTVSFHRAGTCEVTASQAGNADYDAAPQATQSFAIGTAGQTITFSSTAPTNARVGGPTYTVAATGGASGKSVSYGIGSGTSPAGACTISGAVVSFRRAGTCVVTADQAGNADYDSAPQATQSFAIGTAGQTITFSSTAPTNARVGGPAYTVAATGGASGKSVSYGIGSGTSPAGACTISGATVSFVHAGTCVVTADQAGDDDYDPAPTQAQAFTVGKASQTTSFDSTAPTARVDGTTYAPAATGGASGKPVTYGIGAGTSPTGACTISGGVVSFHRAGTCVVTADQAGNDDYDAAPQSVQSFAIGAGTQSVSFDSTTPTTARVGGPTYRPAASGGGSGNDVRFGIGSGTTNGACVIADGVVSFAHPGTCVVTADQAGNDDYDAAPQKGQSFTVGKGSQNVAFASDAPDDAAVDGATYSPTANGGASGSTVRFSVGSGTTNGACSVDNGLVSFVHVGTCVVAADQAGNDDYDDAPTTMQPFEVGRGLRQISFVTPPPASPKVGTTYAPEALGGQDVVFSIDERTTDDACTVDGRGVVSFVHVGTCVVAADRAGDDDYKPASTVVQVLEVGRGEQEVTVTSDPPAPAVVGGSYAPTGAATSGGPVTFTIDAATTNDACSIDGGVVSLDKVGTCAVAGHQAGTDDYEPAGEVTQSFDVVAIGSTTELRLTPAEGVYGQSVTATAEVTVRGATAGGAADGTVRFSVDGSTVGSPVPVTHGAASLALTDTLAEALAPGTTVVAAAFTPTDIGRYGGSSATATLTVRKAATTTTVTVTRDTLTASVTPVAPGGGHPGGRVTFSVAGTTVGTAPLDTHGVATLAHRVASAGAASVAAVYAGDHAFTGSSASTTRTNPTITAKVTGAPKATRGWYRGRVVVSFTCTPRGAALTGPCPAPVRVTRQGAAISLTRTIRATDGGIATVVVGSLKIDRSAPRLKVTGVTSGHSYTAAPRPRCVATDKLSGLARCKLTRRSTTTGTGAKRVRYTAKATDRAGNSVTRRGTYTVRPARTETLEGATMRHGRYRVRVDQAFRLVVTGTGQRPTYYLPEPAPRTPRVRGPQLYPAGDHRWVITIRMDAGLSGHRDWNVGVRYGGKMHVIPLTLAR